MARSNRNKKSEPEAPRRSARTHNEPDRFIIPVDPPRAKKSSSTKRRARKETAVKTAAATKTRKEKPKKAATARKATKVNEPKPKASRKRAREVEPNQKDEPRPKRARVVANIPRRRVATRARPVSPSPPPPPPSPSPSPILPLSPSPFPPPDFIIKEEELEEELEDEVDELEDDRASTAPTEVEPEVVGTGTIPDLQNLPTHNSLFGPPLLTPPLLNPFGTPAHSHTAATAAPSSVVPETPPHPTFAQAATPPAQHGPLLPQFNHATPAHVQNAGVGFEFHVEEHVPPPPTPLARSYAFVHPGNQQ